MRSSKQSMLRKWTSIWAVLITAGGCLLSIGPAAADELEPGILLDLKQTSHFTDLNKKKIDVVSDDADEGERVILGTTRQKTPVKIVIQKAPPMDPADAGVGSMVGINGKPKLGEDRQLSDAPEVEVDTLSASELKFDTSTMRPVSAWAVTPTTASLAWETPNEATKSDVYLNGKFLQYVSRGKFSTNNLRPLTDYTFTVVTPVDDRSGEESRKTFTLRTLSKDGQAITPMTYQAYGTAFQYKTFIPPARVDASMCNYADSRYSFGGDNRGFRSPPINAPYDSPDYRTMMWANVNWQNPDGEKLVLAKNVGKSVTYKDNQVVATSYASTSNMLFQNGQSAGSYAQVRFKHDASNPHCKLWDVNYGGSISYSVIVRFYRSGLVEVVGNRQQAPAHEGWARFNTTAGTEQWLNVFKLGNTGFHCLVGLCGTQTINYARSY